MNIFRSFAEVKFNPDTILTVGTFDGVHLGHKSIIDALLSYAGSKNLRDFILTIHPHPQQIIKKPERDDIFLLTTIDERLGILEKYGVSNVLIIPFTLEFSQISHDLFVREYLFNKIGLKEILVGYDHNFGRNREGNLDTLRNLGTELGFDVIKMNPTENSNLVISSTKIRQALKDKKIKLANNLLGYDYMAGGVVVPGFKRGREIGYPTANVEMDDKSKLLPCNGVYLTRTTVRGEQKFSMTSIGIRPTFGDDNQRTFETYIFDFDDDIYGERILVEFLEFIREEQKFDSVDELIETIKQDERKSRELISLL